MMGESTVRAEARRRLEAKGATPGEAQAIVDGMSDDEAQDTIGARPSQIRAEIRMFRVDAIAVARPASYEAAAVSGAEVVPDGTVHAVLQWVDGDKARAAAAVEFESQREQPRQTLVDALDRLIGTADDADPV